MTKLFVRARQDIVREHDEIGQLAGGQRALEIFLEREPGIAQGQSSQSLPRLMRSSGPKTPPVIVSRVVK